MNHRTPGERNFLRSDYCSQRLDVIQLNGEFTTIQPERILEGLLDPHALLIDQETSEAGEAQ